MIFLFILFLYMYWFLLFYSEIKLADLPYFKSGQGVH